MTLPLGEQVRRAERAAQAAIDQPVLFSVVVEMDGRGQIVEAVCGFRRDRRTWLGRPRLEVCQVRVAGADGTARVMSSGTFDGAHYRAMAAIKESPLSSGPLDLLPLTFEPAAARAIVRRLADLDDENQPGLPQHLALTSRDGRPVWQATLEVPGVGVHTVMVDAAGGHTVYQKCDRFVADRESGTGGRTRHRPGPAAPRPGPTGPRPR